jgi:ribosomal protein S18 acetylase RimI-like enzyme
LALILIRPFPAGKFRSLPMQISREDRVRMERAHVLAWPALRSADMCGWLWRSSGGGSRRANSVSTIDFSGNDLEAAIDAVEARYTANGAAAGFHTYDDTAPPGLEAALRRRGYTEGEATLTMFKRLQPSAAPPQVETRDHAWDEWCGVYLAAITESRRTVNREILSSIPRPSAFFGCHSNDRIISTALCVIGFGCAVVECVATTPDARRQGGARTVMAGLLSWAAQQDADLIGLQVVEDNTQAVRLYRSHGFVAGATNRFWSAPAAS